jgi:transcriptional regulator with XRE-family HTH domain
MKEIFDAVIFGKFIKSERYRLGLSLYDIEKLTNNEISPAYYNRLEKGVRDNPSIRKVIIILNVLGYPSEQLLEFIFNENL